MVTDGQQSVSYQYPPPLYKYLSLAPNQLPPWTERLRSLLEGKAYFPSPVGFNDPFDCLPFFTTPETSESLASSLEGLIKQMRQSMPADMFDEVERAIRNLPNQPPEVIRAMVRASTRRSAENFGVFCLSERLNSVLMWSHYAWNHRGIALLFDLRREIRGGLMPLFKVSYQEDRPVVDGILSGLSDGTITDALTKKADFWAYEQEWRAFKPRGARSTVDFDPAVVRGVILGATCTDDDQRAVTHIIGSKEVSLGKVVMRDDSFGLYIDPISSV